MMQPTFAQYQAYARQAEVVPVWISIALDQETPVTVYRKLVGDGQGFLLESMAGSEASGRYSIIGAEPVRRLCCMEDGAFIRDRDGRETAIEANPFAALRRFTPRGVTPPGLRFTGGAVGYIGYDAVRFFERLPGRPPCDRKVPLAQFLECDLLAVIDHVRHQLQLIAPTRPGSAAGAAQAYQDGRRRLEQALARLAQPVTLGLPIPLLDEDETGATPLVAAPVRSNMDAETFKAAVRRVLAYINAGDVQQVVLSRRYEFPLTTDPFDLYRSLRVVSPSPYMFYLHFDEDTTLLGASPELLVQVAGDRVLNRPLAGTRRRGRTPEEDAALEADLKQDEKELSEHGMLVDLGLAEVGRVSRPGSVKVERMAYIERYSHVMHMASDVVGRLRPELDAIDALMACFPAGTLTGAPKVRAMEIIDELEPVARGPYGGMVGWLGYGGDMDTCIAIRTVLVHRQRGYLQVGAGVVRDSDPALEFKETENKARAGLRALQLLQRAQLGVFGGQGTGDVTA